MREKRSRVLAHLRLRGNAAVDEREFTELKRAFPDCSERLLRSVLRDSGLPLSAVVEGVRQDSLDDLEQSLLALLSEYEAGDQARRKQIRRLVITAKTHARWANRSKPQKIEMVLWLQTWLENPAVFPLWASLRRRRPNG